MRYAMIMAGGAGTRLWPMSRRRRPKQLLPILDGQSLLQLAAARLEGAVPVSRRYVCTGEAHREEVRATLPEFADEQILGEPAPRNTANAVGFTAAVLGQRDAAAVFAVLTADHLIRPQAEFHRRLDLGFALVEEDPRRFVTFAITATFPATGYGWVRRGDPIEGFPGAFRAAGFDEKPEAETAAAHLASGVWGWNSGMFVFGAAAFMDALFRYMPTSHAGLTRIAEAWDTPRRDEVLASVYPALPARSVDYGVMEPAAGDERARLCCVPMDVEWTDLGSWPSYGRTLEADAAGCRSNTPTLHLDSRNVLAVSDDLGHTIATIGCEDLIVVRTADATLVCPLACAQRVRELAERADEKLR